ncbi:hypothetical protein Hanom_Chr06g00570961 [Helianthus anomalus]
MLVRFLEAAGRNILKAVTEIHVTYASLNLDQNRSRWLYRVEKNTLNEALAHTLLKSRGEQKTEITEP